MCRRVAAGRFQALRWMRAPGHKRRKQQVSTKSAFRSAGRPSEYSERLDRIVRQHLYDAAPHSTHEFSFQLAQSVSRSGLIRHLQRLCTGTYQAKKKSKTLASLELFDIYDIRLDLGFLSVFNYSHRVSFFFSCVIIFCSPSSIYYCIALSDFILFSQERFVY